MSRVVVDVERLAGFIERLARFQAHLVRVGDDVDARVQAMRATWSGTAAAAQAEVTARWRAGARDVQDALAALRSVAAGGHANYLAAVDTNRRMWAGG